MVSTLNEALLRVYVTVVTTPLRIGLLVSSGFRLPFFGCQFPGEAETGNSNLFCRAVVVPTDT